MLSIIISIICSFYLAEAYWDRWHQIHHDAKAWYWFIAIVGAYGINRQLTHFIG